MSRRVCKKGSGKSSLISHFENCARGFDDRVDIIVVVEGIQRNAIAAFCTFADQHHLIRGTHEVRLKI